MHFKAVSIEDQPTSQSNIKAWASNNIIYVLNPENQKGQISTLNMFGQEVVQAKRTGYIKQEIHLARPVGCYLVNVVGDEEVMTRKVLVE